MTVKQLKLLLLNVPDDARVLVPSPDHSYVEAGAQIATALYDRTAGWTEDHGEDVTPEGEYGKRLNVVIIE